MNKLSTLLALFILSLSLGVNAQSTTGTPTSMYGILESKLEKSDKDLDNPKKSANPKYWLSRAGVMMDAFFVNYEHLYKGSQELQMTLMFGQPSEVTTETKDGVAAETKVYERVNITYVNGVVDSYKETKPLYEKPLPVAKSALEKAEELDVEKKSTKKIIAAYTTLTDHFERLGVENYIAENYKDAFTNFEASVLISQKEIMANEALDTLIIYNTGVVAGQAGLADESIKYISLAIEKGYNDPVAFVKLKEQYLAKGDTVKAGEILDKAYTQFPNSEAVINEVINFYLAANKADEALEYLKIAQEKSPENQFYIFAEGTLYDGQGLYDQSIATYKRCIEVAPDYYNAYYNLGYANYQKAGIMYKDANNASNADYKKLTDLANEQLKKCIDPWKKCYDLVPEISKSDVEKQENEKDILESLKSVYYRLKMTDEYNEVKAKIEAL